jgi:hypothetical protein
MNQEQGPLFRQYPADPDPKMQDIGWLVLVVVLVTIGTLIGLGAIRSDVQADRDQLDSAEATCMTDAFGDPDKNPDDCLSKVPWYAEHPFWYSAIVGAVVLVVGRIYIFMRRAEMRR